MTVELDRERQAEAQRYATRKRILLVAELVLGTGYLVALILTGLAASLRTALSTLPGGPPVLVAADVGVLWSGYAMISLPLSVVGGWSLPRHYGLSVQTIGQWFVDWLKGEAIGLLLGLIMVEAVYALLRSLPQLWWVASALLYLGFVVLLAHLGPVVLLPLFFKLTPLPPSELTARLRELAERAGARVEGVYQLNLSAKTTAANAALAGLGSTRRIVIGDTLLEHYTPAEIEAVFAHELGHHVHHDIPRQIISQAILTLGALYLANLALRLGVAVLGYRGIADVASVPFLALVLGALGLAASPLVNWLSRQMERAADCYALRVTNDPRAFESTMIRLANQNLAVYRPPRWVEILFYDHPAIAERVEMAERFARTGRCGLDDRSGALGQ